MDSKIALDSQWPEMPSFENGIRRAPDRGYTLNDLATGEESMPIAGVRKEI